MMGLNAKRLNLHGFIQGILKLTYILIIINGNKSMYQGKCNGL